MPQILLEANPGAHIAVAQIRKLAARLTAERVASEIGEGHLGHGMAVGYQTSDDHYAPRACHSICFATAGLLLKKLRNMGATHVILDEVHSRDLDTDLREFV